MESYDFIVVGGGAAGAVIASRLAHATTSPSVLLVEVGGDPLKLSRQLRAPADRTLWSWAEQGLLDHGHYTVPQKHLLNRRFAYRRGKALGGSTVTNYMAWIWGTSADYDKWSEFAGDPAWKWENVREHLKSLETCHDNIAQGMEEYIKLSRKDRGFNGPIDVSYPNAWEKEGRKILAAAEEIGIPRNVDANSGNPLGISFKVSTHNYAERTTSASAFLKSPPANLHIWTDCPVDTLLLKGRRALGVRLADGRDVTAMKEVIVCAGAIDSPRILLSSGIGPANELSPLGINVMRDLPGVGKGLQEHPAVPMMARMDGSFSDRWAFEKDDQRQKQAVEQWMKDQTGPLSDSHSNFFFMFMKLPQLEETPEFKALDEDTQKMLRESSTPHYEMTSGGPNFFPDMDFGDDSYLAALPVGLNMQSRGSVTLASANPKDKPLVDFNFFDHPYDLRVMIEGIKKTFQFFRSKTLSPHFKERLRMPESDSEEDIVEFIRKYSEGAFQASGTVKMGLRNDKAACVDSNFKVYGMEGLRVADMSVCPLVPNTHVQATAYLVGVIAAEKLIAEYKLGRASRL